MRDWGPFADLLRHHRAAANMTQEVLAERSGMSVEAISALERGVRRVPRPSTVELLVRALDLDPLRREALVAAARAPAERDSRGTLGRPRITAPAVRTLPRGVASLTGRTEEVATLTTISEAGRAAATVEIGVIEGMPGVGKTALAVHVAHRLALRFPDGQIFLDLRSHTAGRSPLTPGEALEHLLLAVGAEPRLVPRDVEARAAMWRDRLAGRRMLIVLDNASGHDQVRPLLPGMAGCFVVITSRRRLRGLEDVQTLTLGTLPPGPAAELFVRHLGATWCKDEPIAVAEVVELCGYLPLAIRLVAGRLRSHPTWTVKDLARTLTEARDRLAEMWSGNVGVKAAFQLSYQALPANCRRLYCRLGLHPERVIDVRAVAARCGMDVYQTKRGLEALHDEHLVHEFAVDRYGLHDLVREHARMVALQEGIICDDVAADGQIDRGQPARRPARGALRMPTCSYATLRAGSVRFLCGTCPWTSSAPLVFNRCEVESDGRPRREPIRRRHSYADRRPRHRYSDRGEAGTALDGL